MLKRYVRATIIGEDGREGKFEYSDSKGYRIDFNVVKFPSSVLNTAQVQIYNVSDDTAKIMNEGAAIILEAGYQGKVDVIFSGNIKSITREKAGADIITSIYCVSMGDWTRHMVSKTIRNKKVGDFIDEVCRDAFIKVSRPVMDSVISYKTFFGDFKTILNNLGNTYNFLWNEEDGIIKIALNQDEPIVKFKFDPSSGLLRTPTIQENGIDLAVFLLPQIRPNDQFELDARFVKFNIGQLEFVPRIRGTVVQDAYVVNVDPERFRGRYRVLQLTHEGSTHENVWQTSIQGNYPEALSI